MVHYLSNFESMFWAYCGGGGRKSCLFCKFSVLFLPENGVVKLVVTTCDGLGSPLKLSPVVNTQMGMYTCVRLIIPSEQLIR